MANLTNDLKVQVNTSRTDYRYQETIKLDVLLENKSLKSLLVITPDRYYESGPPYIWKSGPRRIGVMLAEDELPPGFCYYGYNPPALHSLAAGRKMTIQLSIGMPPRVGRIENNDYAWVETPVTGKIEIEVTVGYLKKKFVPQTLAPWAEFLSLQEKTKPVSLTVSVASR